MTGAISEALGLRERFTPHSLRATAASHLSRMGVRKDTIAKLLNHAEGGVTGGYIRHSFDDKKQRALERWERRLDDIIHGRTEGAAGAKAGITGGSQRLSRFGQRAASPTQHLLTRARG